MAAATFVLEGHYHRHIRQMRQNYQRNMALYTCWIWEYFPCEICITRPKGGFLLWIELPEQVDMVCVARQLCRMKIQVAAGSIFSFPANTVIVCASTALYRSAKLIAKR